MTEKETGQMPCIAEQQEVRPNPIYTVSKFKPGQVAPFRNHLCPEYDACLTRAAIYDLHLDCSQCELRDVEVEMGLTPWELNGCNKLLMAIFCYWHPEEN